MTDLVDVIGVGGPLCGQVIQVPGDWEEFAHHVDIDDPLWRQYRYHRRYLEDTCHWYTVDRDGPVALYRGQS